MEEKRLDYFSKSKGTFGELSLLFRAEYDLTLVELARLLGTTRDQLYKYESGRCGNPTKRRQHQFLAVMDEYRRTHLPVIEVPQDLTVRKKEKVLDRLQKLIDSLSEEELDFLKAWVRKYELAYSDDKIAADLLRKYRDNIELEEVFHS